MSNESFNDGIKFKILEDAIRNLSADSNISQLYKEYHSLAKKYDIPKEHLKEISLIYLRSTSRNRK